jgi:hypothetical protein
MGKANFGLIASLLAEGIGRNNQPRLDCTSTKHMDFCRERRKGQYKRHEWDKQAVPHCFVSLVLKKEAH